ncbi:MAG: flagellar type III secretion system protein FliR [Hyphomicrobiaceae bacterium]|nr:flagellar type III secretion system protein FliR [Hyphomicrobiaceae bacterium]MCC0024809.1 flagellar type III secretion system protein FliR [Hyphomicrobiaceae bacterium]
MTVSFNWLPALAFSYLLIFARVGVMLMLAPAIGEQMIPARLRLSFALALALVFMPLLSASLPAVPNSLFGIVTMVLHEMAIGFILGGIARLITSVLAVAGSTMAFQMGLSLAQTADPTQTGVQGAIVGNFLTIVGLAAVFATNLHHLVLAAIYQSYTTFPPQADLMLGDAAWLAVDTVSSAFAVGVQLAAPFIIFGLVFYLGLGLLARLMPQLQVFFIAMPANVGLGLILFALLLLTLMGWYLMHFQSHFEMLMGA